MHPTKKLYKLLALVVVSLCFASFASAEIIVFRPGDPLGNPSSLSGAEVDGVSENAVAVSWTQEIGFVNVFIDVFNLQNNSGVQEMTVNFFLRNTLLGANIGTGSVTVEEGATSNGSPFTGLTLGAGTYFLIASAPLFDGAWLFGIPDPDTASNHVNASFGSEYTTTTGPADFQEFPVLDGPLGFGFEVNGTVADAGAVPEPGTWVLLGTGLLALAGVLRRRRS
jgi:hypothetical protein